MFKYRCVGAYPLQVPDAFLEEVHPGEIIETPHEINSPHFELLEIDGQKPPKAKPPKPEAPAEPGQATAKTEEVPA